MVQTYFCFGNWYLAVNGRSFAQYLDRMPSALKNTLTRKRKKLERSGRAKIEVVTGGAALEAAIAAYRNVYLASWKQPEPYPEFIPALMRTCAEMGWLRLGLVHIDRKPAAAQFWIVQNGVASIYKLAYDERFADFSAGSILTAKLMEHVLDVDKVREAFATKKAPAWVRVHALPAFVHFPHQRHIKALGTDACVTCHGDVRTMPQVYQFATLRMGWCVNCHVQHNVTRDCTVCHY